LIPDESGMKAAEIRQRFLQFFEERGHAVRPSSSLVPSDDPTLLFTNAGMVQFKSVFLGDEVTDFRRAVTSQKCVRAGGKHNDLEEVGKTARHHTFFEMLGNFSFGDYFKRDAVQFAWSFLVDELGIDADRLWVTVHYSDDEAEALWRDEVGVPASRIFRLGDKDNFWQMADTGPCGPCSELHYDLRSEAERATEIDAETFERLADEGRVVELWNLVFMQYDRDEQGELNPLPAPSIDTGAGLERLAAVLQGVDSNFHTDLFQPLLSRVAEIVGRGYDAGTDAGVSYRVLADHARAVAFLLADGVFPSNEGRGYVLRRILRRAVRHAWLLGRREPTLVHVVEAVIETMRGVFPELQRRREHLLTTTRGEEERFLTTIEGGLSRFDEIAPPQTTGTISGEDAFRLYDTFGFPLDLTQLMAEERGWQVDQPGFEVALEAQRARSRADRASGMKAREGEATLEGWTRVSEDSQEFTGYHETASEGQVLAWRIEGERAGLVLARNPFYVESGGQVSDVGRVVGEGFALAVDEVFKVEDVTAVFGTLEGVLAGDPGEVRAWVAAPVRHDTERNHTATHLLHAALRAVLGEHVVQRGSRVAPERLRFDFAHGAPMTAEERLRVEEIVNQGVWTDHSVVIRQMAYDDAVAQGAMALFGEKYGDVVRVVDIPGLSTELCGGTHVRHTAEVALFKIISESGVAAGVRRIEAVTGPAAFAWLAEREARLEEVARRLKTQPDNLERRAEQLLEEQARLEALVDELRQGGGVTETVLSEASVALPDGTEVRFRAVRIPARDADDARAWGDAFLAQGSGVAVLAADLPEARHSLFTFVSDDLIARGIRADAVVREVAERVGGKGGGRPHLAQAGVASPEGLDDALRHGEQVVRRIAGGAS
jgi:alanyl-tRNA synthetase